MIYSERSESRLLLLTSTGGAEELSRRGPLGERRDVQQHLRLTERTTRYLDGSEMNAAEHDFFFSLFFLFAWELEVNRDSSKEFKQQKKKDETESMSSTPEEVQGKGKKRKAAV